MVAEAQAPHPSANDPVYQRIHQLVDELKSIAKANPDWHIMVGLRNTANRTTAANVYASTICSMKIIAYEMKELSRDIARQTGEDEKEILTGMLASILWGEV